MAQKEKEYVKKAKTAGGFGPTAEQETNLVSHELRKLTGDNLKPFCAKLSIRKLGNYNRVGRSIC